MSHGWVYVHIKLQLSKSKHRHPLGFGWKRARENLSEQVEHVGVSNVAMFAWHLGFEWNAVETVEVVAAYIGVGNGGAGQAMAWPRFLTCYYKPKSRVQRAMSLLHSLLAQAIARTIVIGTPWACTGMKAVKWAMQQLQSAQTGLAHSTVKLLIPFTSTWPDHSNFASYAFGIGCCSLHLVL